MELPDWYAFSTIADIPGNDSLREGLERVAQGRELHRMIFVVGSDYWARKAAVRTCVRSYYTGLQESLATCAPETHLLDDTGNPNEFVAMEGHLGGTGWSGLGPSQVQSRDMAPPPGGRLVTRNPSELLERSLKFLVEDPIPLLEARAKVPVLRCCLVEAPTPFNVDANRLIANLYGALQDDRRARNRGMVIVLADSTEGLDDSLARTLNISTRLLSWVTPDEASILKWLERFLVSTDRGCPTILLKFIAWEASRMPDGLTHAFNSLKWVETERRAEDQPAEGSVN